MKPTEKVTMNTETLDDGSAVINFDVVDSETDEVTQTGGYVMARQDDENKCFYVNVFNHNGDVLAEVSIPFIFNNHEE